MNSELIEPLLIFAIALTSGVFGYLLRTRCEQDIYERGFNAGLHRYHTTPTKPIPPRQ
jgi:hypothetical protein